MSLPLSRAALCKVADLFGTPTYVYAASVIERQIERLRALFDGLPLRPLYAMKANAAPRVLRLIQSKGLGVDAVSPGELHLALACGFAPEDILFSANMMTDSEMHLAHHAGVLLNIGELSRLDHYGAAYPGSKVCVRLNPEHGAGHHAHVVTAGALTKFGIPIAQVDDILDIAARHKLHIVGVHQHIGSGILSADAFWKAISLFVEHATRFPEATFFNLGGGLGIPYREEEAEIDADAFRTAVVLPLQSALAKIGRDIEIRVEPGRFLVAQSGVLLTRVNTIKAGTERVFAGTDSGMNQLVRPSLYNAYHAITNVSRASDESEVYDVTGNICETGDVFRRDVALSRIQEGDILALHDAGAYGMVMASEYNIRPLPAEVWVDSNDVAHLIRAREQASDMVQRLLELERAAGEQPPTPL